LNSQKKGESNDLLNTAENLILINPNQSIKIGEQILKTASTEIEPENIHLILSKSYFIKGELKNAIEHLFITKQDAIQNNNQETLIKALFHGITISKFLGLDKLTDRFYIEASQLINSFTNQELRDKYTLQIQWIQADLLKNSDLLKKIITKTSSPEQNPKYFIENKLITAQILNSLGELQLNRNNLDSAKYYFENSLSKIRTDQNTSFLELQILTNYSTYFFLLKKYQKAIDTLQKALIISPNFKNAYYEEKITAQLAKNYIALDDKMKIQEFDLKATEAANELLTQVNLASNAIFNALQKEQNIKKNELQQKFNILKIIIVSVISFLIFLWIFIKWLTTKNLSHAQDVVNYLKLIDESDKKEDSIKKQLVKSNRIPKETEQILIDKLKKFESGNKYTNHDMSLAQMSSQFETNTKYLSEVINKHKGKNFNLYINDLRIKYIVKKLRSEPNYLQYKVSYLAKESGFSSHSSFATIFKNITGISPNVFIKLLKKDLKK
jgi:AraC-like DNA-binding protein